MKPHPSSPEPTELEIQHVAYTLWEQAGRPSGRELEFWLSAKERLRHLVHPPGGRRHLAIPAEIATRNALPRRRENR